MLFRRKAKARHEDTTLGGLLVRAGSITEAQLQAALAVRNSADESRLIGEILVASGAITRAQLEQGLNAQREARGERVDYRSELSRLAATAQARAAQVHARLGEIEALARRIVNGDHPAVTPHGLKLVPRGLPGKGERH